NRGRDDGCVRRSRRKNEHEDQEHQTGVVVFHASSSLLGLDWGRGSLTCKSGKGLRTAVCPPHPTPLSVIPYTAGGARGSGASRRVALCSRLPPLMKRSVWFLLLVLCAPALRAEERFLIERIDVRHLVHASADVIRA